MDARVNTATLIRMSFSKFIYEIWSDHLMKIGNRDESFFKEYFEIFFEHAKVLGPITRKELLSQHINYYRRELRRIRKVYRPGSQILKNYKGYLVWLCKELINIDIIEANIFQSNDKEDITVDSQCKDDSGNSLIAIEEQTFSGVPALVELVMLQNDSNIDNSIECQCKSDSENTSITIEKQEYSGFLDFGDGGKEIVKLNRKAKRIAAKGRDAKSCLPKNKRKLLKIPVTDFGYFLRLNLKLEKYEANKSDPNVRYLVVLDNGKKISLNAYAKIIMQDVLIYKIVKKEEIAPRQLVGAILGKVGLPTKKRLESMYKLLQN